MPKIVILSSPKALVHEFERCSREYSNLHIATAWCGNPKLGYGLPFGHLANFKGKIIATIGTAFNQTHPDGIEFLSALQAEVRIFSDDAELFHPKLYLFSSAHRVTLFVGSSNLTCCCGSWCRDVRAGLAKLLTK